MRFRLLVDGEPFEIDVVVNKSRWMIYVDGVPYRAYVTRRDGLIEVRIGTVRHRVALQAGRLHLNARSYEVAVESLESPGPATILERTAKAPTVLEVRPPMPGRVIRVAIAPGAHVRRGQALVVLEAMKMQNEIPAPADGRVRDVRVKEGDTIGADRVIAVIETAQAGWRKEGAEASPSS